MFGSHFDKILLPPLSHKSQQGAKQQQVNYSILENMIHVVRFWGSKVKISKTGILYLEDLQMEHLLTKFQVIWTIGSLL